MTIVEAGPRILPILPERVAHAARDLLIGLKVDVLTGEKVTEIRPNGVVTERGQFRPHVCCAGAALPASEDAQRWAVGLSGRDAEIPAPVLRQLRLAIGDLSPASR